jgi:hypothetical protein
MRLANTLEFLGIEDFKNKTMIEICKNNEDFLKFTNIRRHILSYCSDTELELVNNYYIYINYRLWRILNQSCYCLYCQILIWNK